MQWDLDIHMEVNVDFFIKIYIGQCAYYTSFKMMNGVVVNTNLKHLKEDSRIHQMLGKSMTNCVHCVEF